MTYPVWPDNLPEPMADGFSHSGEQPVRRQQMESGPDRVTRISSSTNISNTYSICVDEQQLADFWSFYENAANAGADLVLVPMLTGNVVALHVCRFGSYPALSRLGIQWRLSFSLETNQQVIDWS
jgi:hypothetical protein